MQIKSENILGCQVVIGTRDEFVELISNWLNVNKLKRYFICANPHSLVVADTVPQFKRAINNADLVTPDGVGILLASRVLGGNIRERVTGSDIFWGLSERLNKTKGKGYYFLGSNDETLVAIKRKMAIEFPNIRFSGSYSPPYKAEFSEEDSCQMIEAINAAKPDVLWVGMTAPKQEIWIYQHRDQLDVKFIGAVGAVFDFYVGNVKRSHPVFQKIGLEWLTRLLQEPRRLFRRNFVSSPLFLFRVLKQRLSR